MTEQEIVERISELLDRAREATEEALNLGREYGVPVHLEKLGITEDMWYVDEQTYRQEYIDDYVLEGEERELTAEELAEVEEHMAAIRDEGGYRDGYKVLGWMSSSTNC